MQYWEYAAKYKETLLFNRYQSGLQSITKYQKEPPFAYFIPQSEKDPSRPVELLRRLAFNDIRVSQIANEVVFDGKTYPKGTWVVPMDQEYAALARQLLKVQIYPDLREYPEGPPEQPYDAAGWTLPLIFDCEVVPIMKPLPDDIQKVIKPIKGESIDWKKGDKGDFFPDDAAPGVGFHTNAVAAGIIPQKGKVEGSGNQFVINPSQNNGFRALNQAKEKGGEISFDKTNGEYVISGISSSAGRKLAEDLAIKIKATKGKSGTLVNNRIGLYRPWTASMDEGWTRWVLEQYEFDFSNVKTEDISNGNLNDHYDVILLPSERTGRLENGFEKGSVPPEFEGGLGVTEQNHLDEFVRNGGTLICLNQSSELIIKAFGLPVKNEVAGISRRNFFTGGSVMELEVNQSHQVMAGLDEQVNVFVWRSPVFKPLEGFEGEVLASYKEYGSPLRSGYLLGEKYLHGNAAALDVHHGEGHVILFGFRPQWRGQTFGTFRILFNSVLYSPEK